MAEILFYESVLNRAVSLNSLYTGSQTDARRLACFMNQNGWFQLNPHGIGRELTVSDFPEHFPRLDLWLSAYKKPLEKMYTLLYDYFRQIMPETAVAFDSFCESTDSGDIRDRLICMDFILTRDITDTALWTDLKIQQVLSVAKDCMPLKSQKVLCCFCSRMSENGLNYRMTPVPQKRPTVAFSFNDYARMAWYLFSEKAIEDGEYLKKAAENVESAELWLFIALNFVCALRVPDLKRLPVPDMEEHGQTLRDKILDGSFSSDKASELAHNWLFRIEMLNLVPKKTSRYTGITSLIVSISNNYLSVFGKILALTVSFHEEGMPLLSREYATSSQIEAFFGSEFLKLSGSQYFFSTRKCTKSYLQGISTLAENSGTYRVSGFLVASLARSHKLTWNELSEATDNYLRDGEFTGLTPEFVALEMLRRGCFGFIPTLLLNTCVDGFDMLDTHAQTEVIQELAVTPVQLEHITQGIMCMEQRVFEQLSEIFHEGYSDEKLLGLLQHVVDGNAPGKTEENFCLRIVAGLPCSAPDRSACVGCECDLWTRACIHLLLCSFEHNVRQMETASKVERFRLEEINRRVIMSALLKVLENLQQMHTNNETSNALEQMIERRIQYAMHSTI